MVSVIQLFGDLEIEDADIVDGCITVVIDFCGSSLKIYET